MDELHVPWNERVRTLSASVYRLLAPKQDLRPWTKSSPFSRKGQEPRSGVQSPVLCPALTCSVSIFSTRFLF